MKKKILITVSGGVVDYMVEEGIEICVFDFDNYDAGDKIIVPKEFAELADYMGIPEECIEA